MAEQTESIWTESRFRQRLVGAAVVVALAVLLLPLWLDGSGIDSLRVQSVPEKPVIEGDAEIEIRQPPGESGAPLEEPPESLFPDQTPMEARAPGLTTDQPADAVEEAVAPQEEPGEGVSGGDEVAKDSPASPREESDETKSAEVKESVDPTASESDDSADSEDSADEAPQASDDSLPQTSQNGEFVVQLGSFSDEQNAQTLARSVESSGFDVSIEPLFSDQGTVWRVRVGPYQSRDLANEATERLRQRIGRDGLVMTK